VRLAGTAIRVKLATAVTLHVVVRLVRTRRAAIRIGLVRLVILVCALTWVSGRTTRF